MTHRFWLLLAASVQGALAQPVAVTGTVLDESGAAIQGATVTVGRDSTLTSFDGAFRIALPRPGRYTLRVDYSGFRSVRTTTGVPPQSPLLIRLSLAVFEQKIEVAEPDLALRPTPENNLDVVTVDRSALDNLPALQHDVLGALSRFLDPAALGTSGTSMVVDGMEGSHMSVSVSAIQEVRINQNPYSAEFFRPGRSRLEIVTKAGTSSFHGTFQFLLRDYRLDARNALAATRPPARWRSYEGSLTGPLGNGKKSSFVLSANHDQSDQQAVVVGRNLDGEIRRNAPAPGVNTFASAAASHEFRSGHTLTFRHEFQHVSNRGLGVGDVTLPEAGYRFDDLQNHFYTHHRFALNANLINEFSTRTGRHNDWTRSNLPGLPRIVVLDSFIAGSAQADQHRTEIDFQFAEVLSWSKGRHLLKVGGNSYDINRRGLNNLANTAGTFFFSSLDDFRAHRPFSFTQQRGPGRVAPLQKDLGAFLQDNFRLRDNLSFGLGLRADWQDTLGDYNNVAPRASFAWAPRNSKRVVLRGGGGLFFDRSGTRPVADVKLYDGAHLRQIVLTDPAYPNPFANAAPAGQPVSLTRFAPGVANPYTLQSGIALETQFTKATALTVNYTYGRGVKLFRSRDVNAPLPPFIARPDPGISQLRQIESSAGQKAHSLEIAIRGKFTRYFTGTAQYVLSRTLNDSSGIQSFPAYNYDTRSEWSRADFDARHRMALTGTLQPAKHWTAGLLFTARTGNPYSLSTGRDDNRDSLAADRPAGVKRNSLHGPGSAVLDLRLARELQLSKTAKEKGPALALSIESFNLTNHVNYAGFVGNLSSPFFGRAVAALPARRTQAGLRFRF